MVLVACVTRCFFIFLDVDVFKLHCPLKSCDGEVMMVNYYFQAKLRYDPVELDPEDMCRLANEQPQVRMCPQISPLPVETRCACFGSMLRIFKK